MSPSNESINPGKPASKGRASAAGGSGQWRRSNLLALGSAAVLAVYAAGFVRTRPAAQAFAEAAERRPSTRRQLSEEEVAARTAQVPQGDTALSPAPATPPATPGATAAAAKTDATPVPAATPARASRDQRTDASATASAATGGRSDSVVATVAQDATPASSQTQEPAPVRTPVAVATVAAAVPVEATPPAPPSGPSADATVVKKGGLRDGTYVGYGRSGHGDVEATVVILNGKIKSGDITRCLTRWPCSYIRLLPYQIVNRTTADVNNISGASDSTDAYYYAVEDALSQAR